MQHLNEGEIRAYQDHELRGSELERAQAHLEACPQCRQLADALHIRSQNVAKQLAILTPGPLQSPPALGAARARLEARRLTGHKEHETMWNRIFSRLSRPAWAGLAVVTLLAASLAFPPVRAIANNFLGLFRIQQLSVVPVNPGDLPEQLGSSSQLENMLSNDVKFDEGGPSVEVASAAEASAQAGISVRLPTGVEGDQKLLVQPGGKATLNINLSQVRAILSEIGRSDIQLPATLDGATVTVDVPTGVVAQYGRCAFKREAAREAGYDPDDLNPPDDPVAIPLPECTTLTQMPSPTISAPPDLDVAQLGEAYLQVMGMSREEAAQFAQNIDWTTTLVVPIPRYGTHYREVVVDGVTGTLIERTLEEHPAGYVLMWVKDGILYSLSGMGDSSTALTVANSLR